MSVMSRPQGWCPGPEVRTIAQRAVCELRVQRDTRIICLLVSLWFGSSLRSKLRIRANFRTATLAPHTRFGTGLAWVIKSQLVALREPPMTGKSRLLSAVG